MKAHLSPLITYQDLVQLWHCRVLQHSINENAYGNQE